MACSGSHCTNHGTGTTTCSNHRATCSTNRALTLSGEFGVTTGRIRQSDVENLRTNIRAEVTRYNLHAEFNITLRQATAYTTSTLVDNAHINDMETMVQQVDNVRERIGINYATFSYPADATTAANSYSNVTIEDGHWTTLRDKYNAIRTDCICNSDCSCNLVCSCHNNCGCNYSDVRLKENIEYVETRNEIKLYSWNYIWDKTTKHVGVMAHELLGTKYSSAVSKDSNGFYMVNYSKLPL